MTAAFGVGQIAGPTAAGFGFQMTGSFYFTIYDCGVRVARGLCLRLGPNRTAKEILMNAPKQNRCRSIRLLTRIPFGE